MKIILANLPWRSFLRTGVRAGSRWPHLKGPSEKDYLPFPFFLAYAASLLRKYNFDVTLIDAIAEGFSYGQFLNLIKKAKPDLLVCETSTVTLEHDLQLLEKIGRNVAIALCGPDINIRSPSFLKNYKFITYVFSGEYEFTLLDLALHLSGDKNLGGVLGLIYRDLDGVKANPHRPLADLDQFPWPMREGLPMTNYNDTPGDMPLPSAQILASRGCPYCCKFCLWPQVMYQSNHYRARNITDVADEMEYLIRKMNFKSIYFDDDTFNCGKERMLRLCDEIKIRKLNVPWAIMARADLMDEEILEKMRDAGLFAVKYGVESASQELLNNVNKNMDLGKTESMIKFTKMLGIKTHLTFTFGLPGETKETIRKTMDFALRLDPTTIQFSIATPFPGTSFYKEMKESGNIVSENWIEYDGNHKSVIAYRDITKKELERAVRSAYKQWAIHCIKRRPLKRFGYFELMMNSLKKYGIFITFFKIIRFFFRHLIIFSKEKIFYKSAIEEKAKISGLNVGRLTLLFDNGETGLYWDGMKLTRAKGFVSSIGHQEGDPQQPSGSLWNIEKIDDTELLLKRRLDSLMLDEIWRIKVIDEKQLDWDIHINVRKEIEIPDKRTAIILSERYRKWVDIWGEGRFPSVSDYNEVELRNPKSNFIGLRGRKKLKGQLPTILLDMSKNEDTCYIPSARNAVSAIGARVLEVKLGSDDDEAYSPGIHKFFSGRIKIVEEDFKRYKSSHKRWKNIH